MSNVITSIQHGALPWHKASGVCVRCGQTWAEPRRVLCKACAKRQIAMRRRSDPGGAKRAEWKKATKERQLADGLCLECGKPCDSGYKRYAKCLAKIRERARIIRPAGGREWDELNDGAEQMTLHGFLNNADCGGME